MKLEVEINKSRRGSDMTAANCCTEPANFDTDTDRGVYGTEWYQKILKLKIAAFQNRSPLFDLPKMSQSATSKYQQGRIALLIVTKPDRACKA